MTLFIIRNTYSVCFLSAGIAAELSIRPLRRKGVAACLADAVFSLPRTPPSQFLLIPMIAAQRIQTILLGLDGGVEHSAASLTMESADKEVGVLAHQPFLVVFFEIVLILVFPFAVIYHLHILHIAKNIEGFAYPSITEGMRRLDFFQSFKNFLKFSDFYD